MTVEQVRAALADDPYEDQLVWHDTRARDRRDGRNVQWAVYDLINNCRQGGYCSRDFLNSIDVEQYAHSLVSNMNSRNHPDDRWPNEEHYYYTNWECGNVQDFANWLKRSVGL